MSTAADSRTFCFAVFSQPTPCALPRVLEVFAAQGLVPARCHCQLAGRDDGQLAIEVQLAGLGADHAGALARRLSRIVTVSDVLWSEKLRLDAA